MLVVSITKVTGNVIIHARQKATHYHHMNLVESIVFGESLADNMMRSIICDTRKAKNGVDMMADKLPPRYICKGCRFYLEGSPPECTNPDMPKRERTPVACNLYKE